MFKHNIEYVDFNGIDRKEDFYFHLSTPEVIRLEAKLGGQDIESYIRNLSEQQNLADLLDFLEEVILTSYGRKTTDGKSFIKNKELRTEFEYSQAYAELFEEMVTDTSLAAKFGEGVAESAKNRRKKNAFDPKVVSNDKDSD